MTAVAYLRRSSAPNADTRTVSFEMQAAEVEQLAKARGDTIASTLSDWARSGATAQRPGYQQLLAAIEAGDVQTVYGYSLSRLSRSLIDFADLIERCRRHKVRVRLVQEGDIDWKTASGRGFASMVAVFAQMERELSQERVQSAVDARRDRGDHMGQAPYGWRVVAGKLERRSDEDPAAVLAAFHEAGSFGAAAKLLNLRKVPTRRKGTSWNHGTVADIIRQQFPEEAPIGASRPRAKSRTGTMLAGLLRCPCGSTLTPRRFEGVTTYYCARSYRIPGHGKTTIREASIIEWVKTEASHLAVPGDALEMDEPERRVLHEKRGRIIDLMTDGTIAKDDGKRRIAAVDAAITELDQRRALAYVPDAVDWSWSPDKVNNVLKSLWGHVELDKSLEPISAEWIVPEWRA